MMKSSVLDFPWLRWELAAGQGGEFVERVAGASPTLAAHQFSGSQKNFDRYQQLVPLVRDFWRASHTAM